MKILEKVLISIAIVLMIIIAVAFLLPSKWQVQRSIVIHASPGAIYPLVENLKRWQEWIPWSVKADPTVKYTYIGPESGKGSSMKWEGEKLGNGVLTITRAYPDRGISYSLVFGDGGMPSDGSITYEPVTDGTKVIWMDRGDLGNNPVNRYMGLLMNAMLGEDFEEGLAKLKLVVESGEP